MAAGDMYKQCIYAFNFLFICFGLLMIGFGGYLFYEFYALDTGLQVVPFLWVVPGVFMLLVSCLGCCGASKAKNATQDDNCNCWLYIYFTVVFLLFIIQMATVIYLVVILGYVEEANLNIDTSIVDQGELAFNKQIVQAISLNEDTQEIWYGIETQFKCCGYYSYNDQYAYGTCPEGSTGGCQTEMMEFIEKNGMVCVVITSIIAFIEFLSLLSACCLCMCKPKFAENEKYQPYAA